MTGPHPLDPLTADEIRQVAALLKRERGVARPQWRIAAIELREPAKEVVRAHEPGDPVERVARAIVWDTSDGLAYVAELVPSGDRPRGPMTPCSHGNPSRAASPTRPSTSGTSATRPCAATPT